MNKSDLLHRITHSAVAASLSSDAFRLYLLLLAAADSTGAGQLSPSVLRQALGCPFVCLQVAVGALAEARLIEMPPSDLGELSSFRYRLLPVVGGESGSK